MAQKYSVKFHWKYFFKENITATQKIEIEFDRLDENVEHPISGQSYKHFMLVNYDSRVKIISKLLILMTLEL